LERGLDLLVGERDIYPRVYRMPKDMCRCRGDVLM